MTVNYQSLIDQLKETQENFGLLTMQATSTTGRLVAALPGKLQALFSAEHGFFGGSRAGAAVTSSWHPFWNVPIHSLYGETRKPTDEMLQGIDRMVIDLTDIGVRCYTYLATMKNVLEACAERGIPVSVLDRPIPRGGIIDGPMLDPAYHSFVAPINVPLCYGMTPGEACTWIVQNCDVKVNLTVHKLLDWSHADKNPWPNFVPPSPSIRSWDSAVAYPLTVFTEAFPAIDCDRDGSLAFRIIGAPWLDQKKLFAGLTPALRSCGIGTRPYRYAPSSGLCKGQSLNGILFTTQADKDFYPITASTIILSALLARHEKQMSIGAKIEWFDKLMGNSTVSTCIRSGGDLNDIFQGWIDEQDEYLKTRVNLYV